MAWRDRWRGWVGRRKVAPTAAQAPDAPLDDLALVEAAIEGRVTRARDLIAASAGGVAFAALRDESPTRLPAAADLAEALPRAQRLRERGHAGAAAPLLAPFAASDARASLAYARAAAALSPDGAAAIWSAALDRFATPAIAASAAVALADAGEVARAFAVLDAAIDRDPRISLQNARVRLLERTGALSDAADASRALATAQPDDAALAREAARLAHDAGRDQAPADSPDEPGDDPAAARRRANRLIAHGDLAGAVALLEAVVATRGEANDAVALVSAVLLAADPARGAALAAGFAVRWPGDARFPIKVAQLAERAGDWSIAEDHYLRAAAIAPADVWALTGVARALLAAGQFAAARGWLDAAAAADHDAPWPHTIRALVEVRDGRQDAARAALDRAYLVGARQLARYRATLHDHPPIEPRAAGSAALFEQFGADLAAGSSTMLVGNSPALLSQALGREIDAADTVIRLNDFRIAGFEPHVGSRTDWWFSSANRQAEPDRASIGHARSILTQPVPQHVPELPAFARGRLRLDLGPERACFLPAFVHGLSDRTLYPGRTTGLRMILILEFVMQARFRAVGFDFFAGSSLHYFENGADRLTVGESHAVDFERAFVAEVLRPLARFGRYD